MPPWPGPIRQFAEQIRKLFPELSTLTPADYLLAHTLSMVAVASGQASAIWIGAATLDRYLNSIRQPQIYGTQFFFKPGEPTTQEPYNRTLVSDALREQLGVPSQATQEGQRKQYDAERSKQ